MCDFHRKIDDNLEFIILTSNIINIRGLVLMITACTLALVIAIFGTERFGNELR